MSNPLHGVSLCCRKRSVNSFFTEHSIKHSVLGAGSDAAEIPLNSRSGEAMAMLRAMLWAIPHCPFGMRCGNQQRLVFWRGALVCSGLRIASPLQTFVALR